MPDDYEASDGGPYHRPRLRHWPSTEEARQLPDIDARAAVYEALVADSALLLATCRQCRNWIGYLGQMAAQGQPEELVRDTALRRLLTLPERHKFHGPGSTANTEEPREEPS